MKRENRRNILFRYCVIVVMITLLSFWICYNLWDTTYRSADKWNRKADSTLCKVDTILPLRGSILAADGSLLSANMLVYEARVDFRTPKFDEDYYRAAIDSLADTLALYHPVRNRSEWKAYLEKPLEKERSKRQRGFLLLKIITLSLLCNCFVAIFFILFCIASSSILVFDGLAFIRCNVVFG